MKHPLKSVTWLRENIENSKLIILDVSSSKQNIVIPRAKYFDLSNKFSDTSSSFPNTFPPVEQFESESRNLGINSTSQIIIYDSKGIYFSPRVWWMYKTMGHENVFVLNGGLPEWINHDFETDSEYSTLNNHGTFKAILHSTKLYSYKDIIRNINTKKFQLIDARSEGRFSGKSPEPREGLKSGNIPNSINLPYERLLSDGKYKSKKEIELIFNTTFKSNKPLVFSCGSGVTACIVLLASEMILDNETGVYDGSWTEYASLTKTFIKKVELIKRIINRQTTSCSNGSPFHFSRYPFWHY